MTYHTDDDWPLGQQHIVITFDLEAGPGTHTIAIDAFCTILGRLEHDGIEPLRTTIEIGSNGPENNRGTPFDA
jgi:hypothetical protein